MTPPPAPHHVTRLLDDIERGDASALDELFPIVYDDLKSLASGYLRRERAGHTLQPTALVHESYCRIVAPAGARSWRGRAHFFAVAATAMRRVLIDHARARRTAKRGSGGVPLPLDALSDADEGARHDDSLIALDDALADLAKLDPRQSRLVELRFFGGLTIRETAEVLGISHATVEREWRLVKAWLYREVSASDGDPRGL